MTENNDHASRAHALLSASSAERWIACPASAKLAAKYPRVDTAFTQEGTQAHEVAEAVVSATTVDSSDADILGCDPDMLRHALAYRDYIQGLTKDGTTMLLEQRVDFSPWVPDGFGTADCILLTGDTMDVIDYKYGQGVEVSAVRNPQMMLYGLGALNEYGFVYEVEHIRLHIFQPRKDNISVYELTRSELLSFGAEVVGAAARALDEHPPQSPGKHCKFCPHAGRCLNLAMDSLCAIGDETSLPADETTLTPEQVGQILKLEPQISAWLKSLKAAALTDLLNGQEIPGYKVVEGKQGNRAWVDELKVAEALDAAGVAREDYTTVQLLSPAAMDKALGKKRAAELLGELISRAPGAPTIVPTSDKRPKLDRLARANEDFKEA